MVTWVNLQSVYVLLYDFNVYLAGRKGRSATHPDVMRSGRLGIL